MSTLRLLTIVKIAAERTVIGDALVKSEENAARTKQTSGSNLTLGTRAERRR
jgi:hypothetical protein